MWCFVDSLLLGGINKSEAVSAMECYCWVRSRGAMTWTEHRAKLHHCKITQRSQWTNSTFYGSVDR